jgi:RimJ/RimL family protein N-acetyltransferase
MLPAEVHAEAIAGFLAERSLDATRLRLATEEDSKFLLSLRLDPSRNQNISETSSDLDAQVGWMRAYAVRHASGQEAYFLIEVGGEPQGSLRLYDYEPERDSFCWGSWIIRPGAPPAAAYQSAILAYDLAFSALRFTKAHFDVRQANVSVWKFHEKMGARLVRQDALERFYRYSLEDYRQARQRLGKFTQQRDF